MEDPLLRYLSVPRTRDRVLVARAIAVALGAALAFLWAQQGALSAQSAGPEPPAATEEAPVLLPLALVAHSQGQLEAWLPGGMLAEYIREGDIFYLVSGNNARRLDVAWVNRSAASLKAAYPSIDVYVLTAGIANVRLLANGASEDVRAIGYGYEPHMRNEPEFSWERRAVSANMRAVGETVRASGREAFAMPTGRAMPPRDKRGAFGYAGDVGRYMDRVFVQAQAHCQRHDFADGVRAVLEDFAGQLASPWFQVTVDPTEVNGVTAEQAARCVVSTLPHRPGGILLWWGTEELEEARRFLSRRDAFVLE